MSKNYAESIRQRMPRLTRVRDMFGKGAADPAGSASVHSNFVSRWCAWDTLSCRVCYARIGIDQAPS